MPWGSFSVLREDSLEIDRMLELQREFAVSLEAVLIRTVRLTDSECMAFTASRIESGQRAGRYRLDYCVPSANCTIPSASHRNYVAGVYSNRRMYEDRIHYERRGAVARIKYQPTFSRASRYRLIRNPCTPGLLAS